MDRDRLCFQQLGSGHGKRPRAGALGSHIQGCPVCFPGRRSHPAKPVCLLRDFRRILRPLSKATSLCGLGSHVLCQGPAKAFMGRLLWEPRQMVTLRGEKKSQPCRWRKGRPGAHVIPSCGRCPPRDPFTCNCDLLAWLRHRQPDSTVPTGREGRRRAFSSELRTDARTAALTQSRRAGRRPEVAPPQPPREDPARVFVLVGPSERACHFLSPPPPRAGSTSGPVSRPHTGSGAGGGFHPGPRASPQLLRAPRPDLASTAA